MPIYEYLCECGCQIEAYKSMADRGEQKCPDCKENMNLRISPPALHLWKPMTLELETNKPKTYEKKEDLVKDCKRLNKAMPGLDINM